jgi:ATP-binding protein involved in chromosome partitioning
LGAHHHPHAGGPAPAPQPVPGIHAIIAVGSGKGGVGKTTVAVNIAIALAKLGHKVGLLDADIYGPNVPLMLGSPAEQPRLLEGNRIEPIERYGVRAISVGLLNPGDKPLVWRGPMLHQMVRQFLQQVAWGELDYLIIDLPPGTGDVVLSLVQTVPLTGAVVVTTPSDVSLQDGRKAIEMFRQVRVDILGLVENMGHFACPHCHKEIDVFSHGGGERTAKQFGIDFLGTLDLDPNIRRGGDQGTPVTLGGEGTVAADQLFALARKIAAKADQLVAREQSVISIQ